MPSTKPAAARKPAPPYGSPEFKRAVRSVVTEMFKEAAMDSLKEYGKEHGEEALREYKAELGIA